MASQWQQIVTEELRKGGGKAAFARAKARYRKLHRRNPDGDVYEDYLPAEEAAAYEDAPGEDALYEDELPYDDGAILDDLGHASNPTWDGIETVALGTVVALLAISVVGSVVQRVCQNGVLDRMARTAGGASVNSYLFNPPGG